MPNSQQLELEDPEVLREFADMSFFDRLVKKWRQGELFEAAWRTATRKAKQRLHHLRSDLPYQLDAERVITKRYCDTFGVLQPHHTLHFNYWLDSRCALGPESVIYSLGIGGDVGFDRAMASTFGCHVHMYDPTPDSIAAVALMKLKAPGDPLWSLLHFNPIGAWSKDTTLRFQMPARGGGNASAVEDMGAGAKWFDAPCETLQTMMRKNGHTHIDVLKMDIEGAGEAVLESMLDAKIHPTQVVAEFERPRRDVERVVRFFGTMDRLIGRMRDLGYEITNLPRERAKYFSVELLFAKPN